MSIRHPYAAPPSSYLYANVPYHHEHTICRPHTSQLRSFIPSFSSDSLTSEMPTADNSNPDSNLGFSGYYPNREYPPQTSIGGRVRTLLKGFGESMRPRHVWVTSPRNPFISRIHIRTPPLLCCCVVRIEDYEHSPFEPA